MHSTVTAPIAADIDIRHRVLCDIRQVADEAGATPGSEFFRRKTGHSAALWNGEIWARWSDAVREAGLLPNQRKPRLDDEAMLAGLAAAARAMGRIPTYPELLLYRKSGGNLPRRGTYVRHFGSKRALLERLKQWAGEAPDRADISAMISTLNAAPPAIPAKEHRDVAGAVYLFRCGPAFKIGCTRVPDPLLRVKHIAAAPARASRPHH